MRIIAVKLRDIDNPHPAILASTRRDFWNRWRGKTVLIDLDQVHHLRQDKRDDCDADVTWRIIGPEDLIADMVRIYGIKRPFFVCAHLAEVGD